VADARRVLDTLSFRLLLALTVSILLLSPHSPLTRSIISQSFTIFRVSGCCRFSFINTSRSCNGARNGVITRRYNKNPQIHWDISEIFFESLRYFHISMFVDIEQSAMHQREENGRKMEGKRQRDGKARLLKISRYVTSTNGERCVHR